jgi:hypothetical protein
MLMESTVAFLGGAGGWTAAGAVFSGTTRFGVVFAGTGDFTGWVAGARCWMVRISAWQGIEMISASNMAKKNW